MCLLDSNLANAFSIMIKSLYFGRTDETASRFSFVSPVKNNLCEPAPSQTHAFHTLTNPAYIGAVQSCWRFHFFKVAVLGTPYDAT